MGSGVQFTEFVSIRPSLTATAFRDLEIELESPSGKVSVLSPYHLVGPGECRSLFGILPGKCNLDGFVRFGSAKHLGENPAGVWTLRITDHVNGGVAARLNAWSLTVYGHRESPAAPVIESVAAGSESLAVTWIAPADTGTSAVTAYDLRTILTSADETADVNWTVVQDVWSTDSGDLSHVVTGLTGDAEYDVQVRGVNASGDGLWSDTATGTPTTDEAPTIDSVTPGDRSIAVEWTAPTNASLGTIASYDLRYIRSDAPDKGDSNWTVVTAVWTFGSLEYTLNPTTTPLVNGVSYDVQVRAVVGSVQHPWAGVRSATPRTTPGAPAIDSVRAGDLSLVAEWSAPASDGGAGITAYDVRHIPSDATDKSDGQWTVVDDAWTSTSGALEYMVSGLMNDVEYDVQVRAVNVAGEGLWSATGTGTPRTPPGAPESVHVYVYMTGKLEVRWSAADFASTTGFKVQWRSGDQDWDESRSDKVDPATAHVEWSSTPDSRRYRHGLDGLSNGTAYEVRVIASNAGVDGSPSDVATGTPQSDSTHAQAATFIENELISVHEDAHPWLRVAFDWIDAANGQGDPYGQRSGIEFELGDQFWGRVVHSCFNGAGVKLDDRYWDRWARYCHIIWLYIEWDFVDVIPLITHELAHVLTLTNRLDGAHEAELAIARLYFAEVDHGCDYRPAREVLADLLMLTVFGDAGLGEANYWQHCVSRDTEEALGVVRTALAGEMPAWLAETYEDDDGDLELERVWSDIKAEGDPSPVMRDLMRTAFGGLCRSDALWNNAIRIPWRDGGCVPQAPPGLEAVAAVDGIMALSWQSPDNDGGSRVTDYTVQWKSGAQEYDTSRKASVTDPADLSHTIEGLSHGIDYTIRVLAHNINGDGAASEVTGTAVGAEAALGTLTLAGVTFYPTFSSTTNMYEAATGHAATQITIAATAADAEASVAFLDVYGNALTDAGAADDFQVNLSVGPNVIQVRVTAQDGVAATYTVTVTRAEENTSLSPPASDPVPASPSSALYTITFRGSWTTDVTPGGLPGGAHFSPLIGRGARRRSDLPQERRDGQRRNRVDGGDRGDGGAPQRGPGSHRRHPTDRPEHTETLRQHRLYGLGHPGQRHAHHAVPAGHPDDDDRPQPRLVRRRLRYAPARRAGRVAVVAPRLPVSVGRGHRGGQRLLSQSQRRYQPARRHPQHPGDGQVYGRADREPHVHPHLDLAILPGDGGRGAQRGREHRQRRGHRRRGPGDRYRHRRHGALLARGPRCRVFRHRRLVGPVAHQGCPRLRDHVQLRGHGDRHGQPRAERHHRRDDHRHERR